MTQTKELTKERLNDLITIERTLWENNPDTYHERYSPEALLIFPGVGRIDRERAVAAIRQENAEGRAWAEVRFDDVDGRWIKSDAAALIYLHGEGSLELRVECVQNAMCICICPRGRILARGLPPTDTDLEPVW